MSGPTVAESTARQHPANVANRARSARAMAAAIAIADAEVRTIVESYADGEKHEGVIWMDSRTAIDREQDTERVLKQAITYIELREPDAFPWRFVRHPDQPHLVRFEDTP